MYRKTNCRNEVTHYTGFPVEILGFLEIVQYRTIRLDTNDFVNYKYFFFWLKIGMLGKKKKKLFLLHGFSRGYSAFYQCVRRLRTNVSINYNRPVSSSTHSIYQPELILFSSIVWTANKIYAIIWGRGLVLKQQRPLWLWMAWRQRGGVKSNADYTSQSIHFKWNNAKFSVLKRLPNENRYGLQCCCIAGL